MNKIPAMMLFYFYETDIAYNKLDAFNRLKDWFTIEKIIK